MSFIVDLFRREKRAESVVLIDVSVGSVAGAYVHYAEGEEPTLLYTRRLSVEMRVDEPPEPAMLRALQALGDMLIREGAPALARATGSGSISAVLVSIDAPWQTTSVRTELFEEEKPFIFTRGLVAEKLKRTAFAEEGKTLADESIIGTILNGYETRDPYGKEAHRAAVVVLTSLIDKGVAEGVSKVLRSVYHTKRILPIAGSSLRYQAIQKVFPHERDALILDATEPLTSIALMRKGLIVSISVVEVSRASTAESWVKDIGSELAKLAKQYPLPRTIFLLAREPESAALRELLDAANLGGLWLSDDPPKIVSVLGSHITALVRHAGAATPDLLLLLMTLYYQHRPSSDI